MKKYKNKTEFYLPAAVRKRIQSPKSQAGGNNLWLYRPPIDTLHHQEQKLWIVSPLSTEINLQQTASVSNLENLQ